MNEEHHAKRALWVDLTLLAICGVVFVVLIGLGNWQIKRLAWKRDLIETVNSRAFTTAVAAPSGAAAQSVTEDDHAYLRVFATGTFIYDKSYRIKAVTDLGPGAWVMTPLQTTSGALWINRGFVPTGSDPRSWTKPEGQQRIEGLLRLTEPNGTLLETNDPSAGRWFSRDTSALSKDADLPPTPLYFIDADHSGAPSDWPRGGLTQIAFRNSHLSYALTWYAMALLFAGAITYVIYDRLRH